MDDVPAVAVTLNTNDFGDVRTMATLAQLSPAKIAMVETATSSNGNLAVVSGTTELSYLHGACLADFAVVCGNLTGVTMWAPVQEECSLGTLDDNIDQTLFMDEVYVNSLEFGYTTGANATENYGAETDVKMWLLNAGKFVNYDSFTLSGTQSTVTLTLGASDDIPNLSAGIGFLRKDSNGAPAVSFFDNSENEMTNYEIEAGSVRVNGKFVYHDTGTGHNVYLPNDLTADTDDRLEIIYAADAYGTGTSNKYFAELSSSTRPDMLGAVRQGQVEVFIVSDDDTSFSNAWRLTGCTITADLTREPLAELGHLGPYDRPLTTPIPITVTVDSTAGDLENWAKFAGKDKDTDDYIELADLMREEDLKLVVKIYGQTDEEAGGTGSNRTIDANSSLIGKYSFNDGTRSVDPYAADDTEYALKTIVVEHLKITDEGATLDMGANMTQTFGFRSTNDLYAVKGDISISNLTSGRKIRRNA